jgi:hypothetical protein
MGACARHDGGQTWTNYLTGLNQVFGIEPAPASTEVWIGTPGAVGQFLGDGSWKRDYNTWNTGIPDYFIEGMSKDHDGNFWSRAERAASPLRWHAMAQLGRSQRGVRAVSVRVNEPMEPSYQDRSGTHWMGGNGIARWTRERRRSTASGTGRTTPA